MIEQLVTQIISYINYLKTTYNYQITIHDFQGLTKYHTQEFLPYRIHSNSYCLFIKNCSEVWDTCINRQCKITTDLVEPIHFGMCHCGVEEYILPILNNRVIIGFVCISGYRKDSSLALQKIGHVANKYSLNVYELREAYFNYLSPHIPSCDQVYQITAPLVAMLQLLSIYQKDIYQQTDFHHSDTSSIYTNLLTYFERHYREPISLDLLCELFHCSRSSISHMFKQRSGYNINQYVNRLRIQEAKNLLVETNLSITDIAYKVGFTNSNYFASVFKEHSNVSPNTYRKSNKH